MPGKSQDRVEGGEARGQKSHSPSEAGSIGEEKTPPEMEIRDIIQSLWKHKYLTVQRSSPATRYAEHSADR